MKKLVFLPLIAIMTFVILLILDSYVGQKEPTISLTPDEGGPPGTIVKVSGSGIPMFSDVEIKFADQSLKQNVGIRG